MMQAGTSVETVRQWGGWKSLETMLRYLADGNPGEGVKAMQQAEAEEKAVPAHNPSKAQLSAYPETLSWSTTAGNPRASSLPLT